MSFVLFTDPGECISCADYNSDSIVNFTDYADFSDDWNWTGPPGGYNNSDLNCDGIVNNFDIDPFVSALTDPGAFAAAYPGCDLAAADLDGDGAVTNFDIDPFVACLIAGGCE